MVGSIAKFARKNMHVLGTGFMAEADVVCKNAQWQWVRGPYSRKKVIDAGGSCPPVYGDAAMLLPLFWDEQPKTHDVGIVPHYVDYQWAKKEFTDYPVINLETEKCLSVTKQITQCRKIISSSLHGVVAAHAYGIPAAWVPMSDKLRGDGIKFRDHYASLGLEAIPSTMDNPIFTTGTFNTQPLVDILKGFK